MGEESKNSSIRAKEFYRERIIEMAKEIHDTWILNQIYRFIINITKEG